MAQVIGVRFKDVGKIYYFDPLDLSIYRRQRHHNDRHREQ